MAYRIDKEKCLGCGACADACPVECIKELDGVYKIDEDQCASCGNCNANCPIQLPEEV